MTDLADPPVGTGDQLEHIGEFADVLVHLLRSFTRTRARWLAEAEHNVEWSAHAVLRALHNEGAMRAGAVAEHLQFDPSTVSRQVAALVKDGLVERQADPEDGRASVLVLTPQADIVLADFQRVRTGHFAEMLAGWAPHEIDDFTDKLRRFSAAYDDVSTRGFAASKNEKGNEA